MATAQPSPGAELGLPVIAHSPGRKQQAVACVIQPGEGPAWGWWQEGGKGAQWADVRMPARPEALLPTSPSSKAICPASPDL